MDERYGYGMTTEYEEDLSLDAILAGFRGEQEPVLTRHDEDGDGEYAYGESITVEEEPELSYEEFVRMREAQQAQDGEELSYEEFVRMREEQEAAESDDELSYEEFARLREQAERELEEEITAPEEPRPYRKGDARVYVAPKSRRQKMAEEAMDFMANLGDEDVKIAGERIAGDEERRAADEQRRRDWDKQVREFYGTARESSADEIEFDSRFNLSGKRDNRRYVFDGQELDLSAEEGYVPARSKENISHWAEYEGLPVKEAEQKKEKRQWGKRKKRKKGFDEEAVPPAEEQDNFDALFHQSYEAPSHSRTDEDYEFAEEETVGGININDTFPSFKEFYLGELMGIIYKLRFSSLFASPSVYLKDDELGKEVEPLKASAYYNNYLAFMKKRINIAVVLLVLMAWLSLGLPIFGALNDLRVSAAMCLALQLTLMLLNLDIITGGFLNIFRRRFGADSLALISCLISSIDALAVMMDLFGGIHRPYTIISSLSLFGVMLAAFYSAKGLRKSLRVSGIAEKRFSVTVENGGKGKYDTLLKSDRSHAGFVHRSEEMPPDESLYIKISPIILILSLLLSAVVCYVRKDWGEFMYVSSAIVGMGLPVSALLCFALPFCIGSFRIFRQGAAIAGWSGVCDFGRSDSLIITDRDLFPSDCISIDGVVLFTKLSRERCISYAATLIYAAQTCTLKAFMELIDKCNASAKKKGQVYGTACSLKKLENFEILAGGGFKGVIEGHVVILGSRSLMKLMNVKLSHKFISDRSVLLAIDGQLVSVFNIKYEADSKVRKALTDLMRSNTHPIFAVRDFNVTPQMLSDLFDLPTDGYDFPPYAERFKVTDLETVSKSPISAVVCREGLSPLVRTAETGRNIYSVTRMNLAISGASALLGMAIVFAKLLVSGGMGIGFMLAFAVLFSLPVFVMSILVRL